MTPQNVQAETAKQVVKILKSPGCRSVLQGVNLRLDLNHFDRKTPVFVKSTEQAVELALAFGKERS
jgi:hypothetical protein